MPALRISFYVCLIIKARESGCIFFLFPMIIYLSYLTEVGLISVMSFDRSVLSCSPVSFEKLHVSFWASFPYTNFPASRCSRGKSWFNLIVSPELIGSAIVLNLCYHTFQLPLPLKER